MFGFFKYKATLKKVIKAIGDVTAPARFYAQMSSKPLSNGLFGDAYVLGFLQIYLVNVMKLSRKKPIDTVEQLLIFTEALNFYVPGIQQTVGHILLEITKPEHPYHNHYLAGLRDGQSYVDAIQGGQYDGTPPVDSAVIVPGLHDFTQFLKKNYVGKVVTAEGTIANA